MAKDSRENPSVVFVSLGLQGGMAQYAAVLANELVESVPVTAVTADSPETRSLFSDDIDLRPVRIDDEGGGLRSLLINLRAFFLIQWHLRQADADVVHFPFVAGIPSALSTILACLNRDPVVGTIHDPVSHVGQEVDFLRWDLREVLVGATARFLDAVIIHGDACREQARELGYPMEKVHVLPHGLYSHYDEGAAADVEREDATLLFFGKIRPNKGFDRIPELLDRVAEDVPDVRAVVAGSPDVAPQIDDDIVKQTLEELRGHDRVELHDEYVPNKAVPTYFRRASVVVLPYYDATVSGVAMIAYAFGTPIVATDTGDLGPMIEADETGLLASPDSTAELADQVVKLLTDDGLRADLRENIRDVREEYAWEHIAERTIVLYREVLDF